jgi:hypothetical protein
MHYNRKDGMDMFVHKVIRLWLIGFCFMAWSISATIIHVILLWHDQTTKKWEILLSRDSGTAIWTDFDHTGQGNAQLFARSTIRDFTRGRYNEKNAPLHSAIDLIQYDQHFFFVPVVERVDDFAMRRARNMYKRDFVWVPLEEFLGYSTVHDRRQRKSDLITVEPNLRAVVRILWPEFEKRLVE